METELLVVEGDITEVEAEAVVSPTDESLLRGGDIYVAIHQAAGPGLLEECRALGGIKTGEAIVTSGHNLLAKWVIHTADPAFKIHPDPRQEPILLASCYVKSLELAKKIGARTIAFPPIYIGDLGYPRDEAAMIACNTVWDFIDRNPGSLDKVIFVIGEEDGHVFYARNLRLP